MNPTMFRTLVKIAPIAAFLMTTKVNAAVFEPPLMSLSAREVQTNNASYYPDWSIFPSAPGPLGQEDSPDTTTNFLAMADPNTVLVPDTHGAVGTNYVMTMLNTGVRIQTRTGTVVYTNTLRGFWTNSSYVTNANTVFDPKVIYDPFEHHFIATACTEPQSGNSTVLIGVSSTGDPTGSWNIRQVKATQYNDKWADFPSIGFNKKWIAIQVNMFFTPEFLGDFDRSHIFVFDKTNLYAGSFSTPTLLVHDQTFIAGFEVPAVTMDNTLDRLYLVQNVLDQNLLRLFWIEGSIGSETLVGVTNATYFAPGKTWKDFPMYNPFTGDTIPADNAPQTNSTALIQSNDGRMGNVVYRNGSLWCAHTIYIPQGDPPYRSGIQWYQLNPVNHSITQIGRVSDESGVLYYGFPSIAVNKFNDVLLGYARHTTNAYASGAYSFRAFNDPANSMRTGKVLKLGEGVYQRRDGSDRNRWGDYSATVVDPLDDAHFWTIQEFATTPSNPDGSNGTGRWGTWWGNVQVDLPGNDNFANAFTLSGQQGSTNTTNLRSTGETGEPTHAGNTSVRSVWYNWTASASGPVTFETTSSTISSIIAIYTGSAVNSLTLVTNANGNLGVGLSRATFTAGSGVTYRIAVDGQGGTQGTFALAWTQPSAPLFTQNPGSTNVIAGNNVTFTATAIGVPTPTYQWKKNGSNISGATSSSYTITSVQSSHAGSYTVVASNSAGNTTSDAATLTVYASATPQLLSFVYADDQFRFSVVGVPNYQYIIQSSANLTNWASLQTNLSPFWFTNFVSTNDPYLFYRSMYLP